jgi:hypothetical protein
MLTKKGWTFFLENKSDILKSIIIIFFYLIKQSIYEKKIKIFHFDDGSEYDNTKVVNYCKEKQNYKNIFSSTQPTE